MYIYLIASESIRQIDEKIKNIIKEEKNIETFDLNSINIADILNEASYLSLFDEKKIIIAKNASFFGSGKISEKDSELLLDYLKHPNIQTILIFTYNGKVDTRKKITKELKEKYTFVFLEKLTYIELKDKIANHFQKDGFTITSESINYIINACLNNYDLIYNEIEKIKIYYNKSCEILFEDVKKIVSKNYEDNNFKFIEAVIKKDINKSFALLDELCILKIEPISLINLLAREYRLMHFIKTFYEEKENINTISQKLKLQNWQIEKLLKNSFNFSFAELENNLLLLNECDLQMKKVYFDKYAILKAYLLKILD